MTRRLKCIAAASVIGLALCPAASWGQVPFDWESLPVIGYAMNIETANGGVFRISCPRGSAPQVVYISNEPIPFWSTNLDIQLAVSDDWVFTFKYYVLPELFPGWQFFSLTVRDRAGNFVLQEVLERGATDGEIRLESQYLSLSDRIPFSRTAQQQIADNCSSLR